MPGVVRVLAADVPGVNDAGIKHDEPLFPTEVCYFGHPVAWVLGETLEAARLGAAAVVVEADPLPALVTVKEAIAAKSTRARSRTWSGATSRAPWRLRLACSAASSSSPGRSTSTSRPTPRWRWSTRTARSSCRAAQHPSETQEIVAHVLGRHSHDVTVQCLRMGGGFGGKEMQPHGYAAIAALGSTLTGRPVRLRLNRTWT